MSERDKQEYELSTDDMAYAIAILNTALALLAEVAAGRKVVAAVQNVINSYVEGREADEVAPVLASLASALAAYRQEEPPHG